MRFGGRIIYSKTASEVDMRAMQLLRDLETKRDQSGRAIVGFDVEWRPDFTKGFVGVGIGDDSAKLFRDHGVSIKDVEDLSDLADKKLGGNSKKWGLASLTKTLVSKEVLKPKCIMLGNSEAYPLSKKQLEYAATDAYASWYLIG
ncbi:unnamed protein product [Microthlaspi erraticum]|uniref:3'-5' exonuclease n=1 Tax=Microthlaspi erraticum TaxID=1685480 RepID=A0A6D2IK17_9BRAS|nr:unnamed protein product [Microthlaspi erraticum]